MKTALFEHKDNNLNEINSYLILSRNQAVEETEMEKVIENKHDPHPKSCVNDPNYNKFQHRSIK